jgi:hypothetical protein
MTLLGRGCSGEKGKTFCIHNMESKHPRKPTHIDEEEVRIELGNSNEE